MCEEPPAMTDINRTRNYEADFETKLVTTLDLMTQMNTTLYFKLNTDGAQHSRPHRRDGGVFLNSHGNWKLIVSQTNLKRQRQVVMIQTFYFLQQLEADQHRHVNKGSMPVATSQLLT